MVTTCPKEKERLFVLWFVPCSELLPEGLVFFALRHREAVHSKQMLFLAAPGRLAVRAVKSVRRGGRSLERSGNS